ncbi:cytidylyltransferase domain-containing protein [Poseidonibacter lekithochrous]|uniref:acylneuraminate cytidylyltransferase family protein n=1 Tax=Poseidonibacter lekithochrous TaxID=1904463 RepID=UPI0008FC26A1|nr:acylneuraminate cytidylyltransferase family protein [Poseidonibacter lekithochrous]QKJ22264.1 acylneuraminate cytidylyltransferase family protein [Poseidonibacter lekithochrous]
MTKSRILAVIPARGGSKGLPGKNIIDFAGKPLITWTIESSINSKYISKTIVSSDDYEILTVSRENNANTLKRPDYLALDTTATEPVVLHVLDSLKISNEIFDYIILLQPTSPLRSSKNIDEAFDLLLNSDATSLISVCEIDNKILKAFKKNDKGFIEGISNNKYPFMRRQDLPNTYMSNGAIYIIKTSEFLKNNSFLTTKTVSYLMNSRDSIDIDNETDLVKARAYI